MDAEEFKSRERETYDAIAEVYDARMSRYLAHFASNMIDMLYPQEDEAGLDVAGGSGAAGLKLAERIGPHGSVTIIDISPEMLKLAGKNAAARKLDNVRTSVMDAEKLEFDDNSFDLATCSFGVMFFPNVSAAVSELKRVLKPGGRLGFSVWSVPERFPFYSEVATAFIKHTAPFCVRTILKVPVIRWRVLRKLLVSRSPLGFSPSRFGEDGTLEKHLHSVGFESVRRLHYAHPLEFISFEECWEFLMRFSSARDRMRKVPDQVLASVREELRGRLVSPKTGEVRFFNEAAIILARRPA